MRRVNTRQNTFCRAKSKIELDPFLPQSQVYIIYFLTLLAGRSASCKQDRSGDSK